MSRKLTVPLVVIIIAFGIVVSTLLSNQKEPMRRRPQMSQQRQLFLGTVQNEDISTSLEFTGHLYALDKVELYAEVSGILLSTPKRFKEGNYFSEGEELVHIDDSVYRNNVLAQRSSLLNQLTLLLPDLSIDFPESAPAWEKYLQNYNLDEELSPLPQPANQKEKYYIASRNIFNLYYSIKSMEATLAKYTLTAPYDGVVTLSNINPGTLVRMGQKLGEFTNTNLYEMEAFVGIGDLPHVRVGQRVRLTCDDIPGEFGGVVQRINGVIDKNSQTVKVYITTRDRRLKEGLYLTASLESPPIENAYRLPRKSLVGAETLWVVRDSTLSLRRVTIAGDEKDDIIVQGLENGTQVLLEPLVDAYEGMKLPQIQKNNVGFMGETRSIDQKTGKRTQVKGTH